MYMSFRQSLCISDSMCCVNRSDQDVLLLHTDVHTYVFLPLVIRNPVPVQSEIATYDGNHSGTDDGTSIIQISLCPRLQRAEHPLGPNPCHILSCTPAILGTLKESCCTDAGHLVIFNRPILYSLLKLHLMT